MDGDRSSTSGPGCSASAETTQTSQTMYVEPNAQHRSSAAYCKRGGGGHQSQSEPIRANQSQSEPISANQCQSEPINANQSQSEPNRANYQRPSACHHQHAIISMQSRTCSREIGSVGRLQSVAISGNQWQSRTCSREVGSVGRLQPSPATSHHQGRGAFVPILGKPLVLSIVGKSIVLSSARGGACTAACSSAALTAVRATKISLSSSLPT